MLYEHHGACPGCRSHLGCKLDCYNAPWNFDKPRATPFGYMLRYARWRKSVGAVGPITYEDVQWDDYRIEQQVWSERLSRIPLDEQQADM